jgi:Uma2 family endonuclease
MNLQTPTIKRPATYQDVLDAPEGMVAELIRGTFSLQPRPRPRPKHSRAITKLGTKIVDAFDTDDDDPNRWTVLIEPELQLGEEMLVCDLAGWRRDRLPTLPDEVGIAVAPDWICEAPSPSTRTYDLIEKRDIYREQGVGHLWFVDPAARTLEAFALKDGSWVLIAALHDDAEVTVAPFEAAPFAVAAFWAD